MHAIKLIQLQDQMRRNHKHMSGMEIQDEKIMQNEKQSTSIINEKNSMKQYRHNTQ